MSTHALDSQMQERLVNEVAKLRKEITELRTLQLQGNDAVNMAETGHYEVSATIPNGGAAIFGFHLNSDELIFSTFCYSMYQGTTQSEENLIGGLNTIGYGYKWQHWRDQGETVNQSPYNVSDRFWVENNTGSSQTVKIVAYWRYIITDAEVSVS